MANIRFYIVDVFAETPLAGNQLAVFRGPVPEAAMQRLAREMNFSESTFITAETPVAGAYPVRIFTPNYEMPFAGHPTLGTAHILRTEVAPGLPERVTLQLQVGPIPVTFEPDGPGVGWMEQIPPEFGATLSAEQVAPALSLEPGAFDPRWPVQEVSTGLPFIVAPLKCLADLQEVRLNTERYYALIEGTTAKLILAFCPETRSPQNRLSARVFGPYYGFIEDPATGSGNGCLAAYLVEHRFFGEARVVANVEQGYEIGRPSLLRLQAEVVDGTTRVRVGGLAITVMQGELSVDLG